MYSKEMIIREIKRIADKLGVSFLKQKDFEENSTIPFSTVRYHMGTWKDAVRMAGLDVASSLDIITRDDLLKELGRLYLESGEIPTPAMIKELSDYSLSIFLGRWKSINEAFAEAREKFGKNFELMNSEMKQKMDNEEDIKVDNEEDVADISSKEPYVYYQKVNDNVELLETDMVNNHAEEVAEEKKEPEPEAYTLGDMLREGDEDFKAEAKVSTSISTDAEYLDKKDSEADLQDVTQESIKPEDLNIPSLGKAELPAEDDFKKDTMKEEDFDFITQQTVEEDNSELEKTQIDSKRKEKSTPTENQPKGVSQEKTVEEKSDNINEYLEGVEDLDGKYPMDELGESENEMRFHPDLEGAEDEISEEKEELLDRGNNKMNQKNKIKFIPQTVKPKNVKRKLLTFGEPISFRGVRYGPVDEMGVVFLFGMVSLELGFIIESFQADLPQCHGRRCVDETNNHWEYIKIAFAFKSLELANKDMDEKACDLLICWEHDWEDCPFEVLELRHTIEYLKE